MTMHHVAHFRFTVALGLWVALLLLFLVGGNLWLPREGLARKLRVRDALLFTAGLAVGFLLMPGSPALGGGVIIAAWIVVLISSVRRACH